MVIIKIKWKLEIEFNMQIVNILRKNSNSSKDTFVIVDFICVYLAIQ